MKALAMRAIPAHVYRPAAAPPEFPRQRLIRQAGAVGGRVIIRIEYETHADAASGGREQRFGYASVGQIEHRHIDRVAPPGGGHVLEERGADRALGEHLHADAAS